jgi:hypothetical protein
VNALNGGNLKETRISGDEVYRGTLLRVQRDLVRLPDGTQGSREYIRHPGAVAMVPLFGDGRVLLERQFRYPHGREFIVIPAGKLEPGEPHLDTARPPGGAPGCRRIPRGPEAAVRRRARHGARGPHHRLQDGERPAVAEDLSAGVTCVGPIRGGRLPCAALPL